MDMPQVMQPDMQSMSPRAHPVHMETDPMEHVVISKGSPAPKQVGKLQNSQRNLETEASKPLGVWKKDPNTEGCDYDISCPNKPIFVCRWYNYLGTGGC